MNNTATKRAGKLSDCHWKNNYSKRVYKDGI